MRVCVYRLFRSICRNSVNTEAQFEFYQRSQLMCTKFASWKPCYIRGDSSSFLTNDPNYTLRRPLILKPEWFLVEILRFYSEYWYRTRNRQVSRIVDTLNTPSASIEGVENHYQHITTY